jgi:hypothetical protein
MFEAHITYDGRHRAVVEYHCPKGWKFSAIDGDPVLGKKVFCYLTSYDVDGKRLLERLYTAIAAVPVLPCREKIEMIVYDTKTGVNVL